MPNFSVPTLVYPICVFSILQVVGVGAANGCDDVGGIVGTYSLDGITGNVTDGSKYVTPSVSISGKLAPGDRIRINGSFKVGQIYSRRIPKTLCFRAVH